MKNLSSCIKNKFLWFFHRTTYLIRRAWYFYCEEGFAMLIRRVKIFLFLRLSHRYYKTKIYLSDIFIPNIILSSDPIKEKSIAYLLFNYECCGGNRVIFEHANRLMDRGWDVILLSLLSNSRPNWFGLNPKIKLINFHEFDKWLLKIRSIVATYHLTLKYILDLPSSIKKFYFVQSDERKFYDTVSLGYFECEETYRVPGINLFCIARWLQEWLKNEFDRKVSFIPGKVNFNHFFPERKFYSNRPIVLIEGDVNCKFKGVQEAYEAIRNLNCEKWLLTNSKRNFPIYTKGFDSIWNIPPQDILRQVISSAGVLIKPSYFEACPVSPMEAMTCGTAVVIANNLGSNEYCIEDYNCLKFMPGDIEGIKESAQRLISNIQLRNRLIVNGLEYAKQNFDYEEAIDILEDILLNTQPNSIFISFKEFKESITNRYLNYLSYISNV